MLTEYKRKCAVCYSDLFSEEELCLNCPGKSVYLHGFHVCEESLNYELKPHNYNNVLRPDSVPDTVLNILPVISISGLS